MKAKFKTIFIVIVHNASEMSQVYILTFHQINQYCLFYLLEYKPSSPYHWRGNFNFISLGGNDSCSQKNSRRKYPCSCLVGRYGNYFFFFPLLCPNVLYSSLLFPPPSSLPILPKDGTIPHESIEELSSVFVGKNNFQSRVFENMGHMLVLEGWEEVGEEMVSFYEKLG